MFHSLSHKFKLRILPTGAQLWSTIFWSAIYPSAGTQVRILLEAEKYTKYETSTNFNNKHNLALTELLRSHDRHR